MYKKILVPVDGSLTSDAGLEEAIKLAKITGAQIRLLHTVDDMPFVMQAEGYGAVSGDVRKSFVERAELLLENARARVVSAGVDADTVMSESMGARLVDQVLSQIGQWGADLVVLGTHGRRGIGRMVMGSDAEGVARVSPVPVLLVRFAEQGAASRTKTGA
jgi:nucleotide-binding universal stress UspA family protein